MANLLVDTYQRTTKKLDCLRGKDVGGIIRYYARKTGLPEKRLTRSEAEAIVAAGMTLAVVHQSAGNTPHAFSEALGILDGAYARTYATEAIGQPNGSAIYFAVDYDASPSEIEDNIVPYFKGIRKAFQPAAEQPEYAVGVYGSGLVCRLLKEAGLVRYTWLSQSTGHRESKEYRKSGAWALAQGPQREMCGLDVDTDEAAADFGGFARLVEPGDAQEMADAASAPTDRAEVAIPAASGGFDEAAFVTFVESLGLRHIKPYELLVLGSRNADPHSPCYRLNTLPPHNLWNNIAATAKALDALRSRIGAPVRLLSAYRAPAYNRCIGGAGESHHMRFNAIDFAFEGNSRPVDWARTLRSMRDDEKLFKGGVGLYAGFVHVDTRGHNVDWQAI